MKITVTPVKKIANVTQIKRNEKTNKTTKFHEVVLVTFCTDTKVLTHNYCKQMHKLQCKWVAFASPSVSGMFFTTVSMETSLSRHA